MKKLYILILSCFALTSALSGCSDFLDVTPNKSGSAYIYHMDQLYGLMGNPSNYRTGTCWTEQIFMGDGVEYSPYYAIRTGSTGNEYDVWTWDTDYLTNGSRIESCTWTPVWNTVFTFNTALENLDKVTQTTEAIRKQVEGEALFGRAYYHFIALVQYALWDEDAPGIGYRTNTNATDIPARETVGYTLERIYKDLEDAEAALTAAGRTQFDKERNFRPTVPTVKALRARIDLYRGNYTSALQNANDALAAYDVLLDFKNDELYKMYESEINVLNQDNTAIDGKLQYHVLTDLLAKAGEAFWKYDEFILPQYSDLWFANRSIPISESYYDLFDREHDERWIRFYGNNYIVYNQLVETVTLPGSTSPTTFCFKWEDQQGVKEANRHAYLRFVSNAGSSGKYYILGLTTAEMYLIKAECLARAGQTGQAAEVLKTLRRTRFSDQASADNIGGTVQEVLDERAREMTELWRFFDIKRLNGAENANISIQRTVLKDYADINSAEQITIAPDDHRWALPITYQQLILMGWEQN